MARSRFGIVIPAYNAAATLAEAVDSVLSQNHPSVEIFVADGGSTDATVKVLRGYRDRLRWISESDAGQTDAIIKGLSHIDAELVTWLNADDRLLPASLEAVDHFFRAHPEVEFVYGDIEFIHRDGRLLSRRLEPAFNKFVLVYGHNLFADPACFWRGCVFERTGPLNPAMVYSMDYEFWVRCADHGVRFGQIQRPLAQYRIDAANKSIAAFQEMRQEHFHVLARRRRWLKWLPVRLQDLCLTVLLHLARGLKTALILVQRRQLPARKFSRLSEEAK